MIVVLIIMLIKFIMINRAQAEAILNSRGYAYKEIISANARFLHAIIGKYLTSRAQGAKICVLRV